MINILKFAEKNQGIKGTQTTETINNLDTKVTKDIEASKKQIRLYEEAKEYIESIVDNDGIIQNIPTMNNIELKNYSIQFDGSNSYIHIKDITTSFTYGTFSLGNKKLLSGDNTQFIIFNILQRISCPNASTGCKKFCYANKTNTNVNCKNSSSRNSRVFNTILTMFKNFAEIVTEVIEFIQKFTQRKITFRFHESGDIYSMEYWQQIKKVMIKNESVNFMYYTKTFFVLDEINDINNMDNVSLRYSLDDTTNKHIVNKVDSLNCLTFIVMNENNTCADSQIIGHNNICNTKNVNLDNEIKRIEELKSELLTANKTQSKKIQSEINSINKSIIDNKKTCTKCMKCFNKNQISLFVATH